MERREILNFPGYIVYDDGRVWSAPKGCGPNVNGKCWNFEVLI